MFIAQRVRNYINSRDPRAVWLESHEVKCVEELEAELSDLLRLCRQLRAGGSCQDGLDQRGLGTASDVTCRIAQIHHLLQQPETQRILNRRAYLLSISHTF